jgi:hypothetical protein
MLAISTTRTFRVQSTIEPTVFVTFKFIGDHEFDIEGVKTGMTLMWKALTDSIIKLEGIVDVETEEEVKLTEAVAQTVFNWIRTEDEPMFEQIIDFYNGLSPKKLKSGVKQQDSGTGDPVSVTPVS